MNEQLLKIVIVEDDATLAAVEKKLLEERGYSVLLAETGADARTAISEWRPDIVILDIQLPDANGLEILNEIVTAPEGNKPNVIAVSGTDDIETVTKALELGAADFIRKPFAHREFLLRVSGQMQLREYKADLEIARDQLEKNLGKLSRYFSRDILSSILDGRITETLSGELTQATIMFFDLRNSTALGEQMVSPLFFQFLTAFFGGVSDIVYRCGGSITKFTGDGFLATFGLREYSKSVTVLAISCAMQLREHIALYNKRKPPYLKDPVGYGIGITTGEVYAGNVGSRHKLEYTVFGDTVNLAARLENTTKLAHVDILIDEKTREICGDRLTAKKVQATSVRGKSENVAMYFPEILRDT